MKFARFRHQGKERYGVVEEEALTEIQGDPFEGFELTQTTHRLGDVKLLAPALPSKMVAVALNYRSHAGERAPLAHPELFLKAPSSLIGPGENIVLPKDAGRVDLEGELVVVMKRRARKVSAREALDFVLGYTCGNDVSAREWQRGDIQWWRAKSSDTFAPVGPFIVEGLDPGNLELRVRLNGQEVQSSNTSLLIHNVASIISFASQVMTLEPGDMIFTGTPGTTSALNPGDAVEVEIDGIGTLRNPVSQG